MFLTGGDPITAMQVAAWCRPKNIAITAADVLHARTVRKLAASSKAVSDVPSATDEEAAGSAWGLLHVQQMFFEAHPDGLSHYNQSFLLKLKVIVPPSAAASALQAIVARHLMLCGWF